MLEPGEHLGVIWLDLVYNSGEKAEAWKSEVTCARLNHGKMAELWSKASSELTSLVLLSDQHTRWLIVSQRGLLQYFLSDLKMACGELSA